jgi:hypothetical protein
VGHSLGGRLALQYAHEQYHDQLQHNMRLLDTVSGRPHASVVQVLEIAESLLDKPNQHWSGVTCDAERNHGTVDPTVRTGYSDDCMARVVVYGPCRYPYWHGGIQLRLGFGTKVARDLVEDFGHQDLMYELQQINRILAKSQ